MEEDRGPQASGSEEAAESLAEQARHLRQVYHARECAVVGAMRERYGEEAFRLARKANYEAGFAAGHEALDHYRPAQLDLPTAADLILKWGRGGPPVELSQTRIVYRNERACGFWPVWRATGLPLALGCDYNGAWTEGFLHAINPRIRHGRPSWRPRGDTLCEEVYELDEK